MRGHKYGQFVVHVSNMLKSEGLGSSGIDSADTRRQALERAQKVMHEWGCRPSHVAHQAPLAAALAFVPNRGEVDARMLGFSKLAIERVELAQATYVDERRWWGLPTPPLPLADN